MSFRKSAYIDFDAGIVAIEPMELQNKLKTPRLLDEMLELFECRVDVWQLGPAVQILRQIECQTSSRCVWYHAAYALLSVIATYFEMIGKSLNPGSMPKKTAGEDFNHGFCDVYPSFAIRQGQRSDEALPDVKEIRDRLRNGLYHLGYTKANLLIHNDPSITEDFLIRRTTPEPVYLVNPHRVTRTIVGHFPGFMARLRDTDQTPLRERFQRYFEEYHGLGE